MFTLHVLQITTAGIQADNPVSSVFVMVSENISTICFGNFHTEYGKSVATVTLFSKTPDIEFSNVCVENLSFL